MNKTRIIYTDSKFIFHLQYTQHMMEKSNKKKGV